MNELEKEIDQFKINLGEIDKLTKLLNEQENKLGQHISNIPDINEMKNQIYNNINVFGKAIEQNLNNLYNHEKSIKQNIEEKLAKMDDANRAHDEQIFNLINTKFSQLEKRQNITVLILGLLAAVMLIFLFIITNGLI